MPDSVLDTNVLLNAAGSDSGKAQRAEALIGASGMISVQVLNELTNVACRKMRLDRAEIHDLLDALRGLLDVVAVTIKIHEAGLELAARHQLSTYDAMIVAAALDAGCTTLWSEDMQHGLMVDGRLQIRNPFWPD